MSAQVYSVSGQTEGRRKGGVDKHGFMWGQMLTIVSVHHPIPSLPVGIENTLAILETNQ